MNFRKLGLALVLGEILNRPQGHTQPPLTSAQTVIGRNENFRDPKNPPQQNHTSSPAQTDTLVCEPAPACPMLSCESAGAASHAAARIPTVKHYSIKPSIRP